MAQRNINTFGSPGLRLVQLYVVLARSGAPYTLTRLTQIMSCSRQTVLRMMEQIQLIRGVELETWIQNKERYYQMSAKGALENLMLSPETLRHLAFCSAIVRHLLPDDVQKEIGEGLEAVRGDERSRPQETARARPLAKGRIDYNAHRAKLKDLQTALLEQRLCRVTYPSRNAGTHKQYLIAPLRIIAYREALYLRCRLYDAPGQPTDACRTFAIQRLASVTLGRARFNEKPESGDAHYFGFPFHDPIRVRAAFWNGAARYVSERIWSSDQTMQHRGGALILEFTTTSRLETTGWILGFGADAELLEPADLRAEVARAAQGITARYERDGEGK